MSKNANRGVVRTVMGRFTLQRRTVLRGMLAGGVAVACRCRAWLAC